MSVIYYNLFPPPPSFPRERLAQTSVSTAQLISSCWLHIFIVVSEKNLPARKGLQKKECKTQITGHKGYVKRVYIKGCAYKCVCTKGCVYKGMWAQRGVCTKVCVGMSCQWVCVQSIIITENESETRWWCLCVSVDCKRSRFSIIVSYRFRCRCVNPCVSTLHLGMPIEMEDSSSCWRKG